MGGGAASSIFSQTAQSKDREGANVWSKHMMEQKKRAKQKSSLLKIW